MQTWLFSCELLDTMMVLTKKGVFVLGSNRKADYFKSVAGDASHAPVPPLTTIHRNKVGESLMMSHIILHFGFGVWISK